MPTLSFTQVTGDLNRPGSGANQWSYGQNIINIPTQGINTQRLNTYWRFLWNDFQPCNGSQNLYSFAAFDAQFQDAINKKQRISFGIMQQCDGCDSNLLCSATTGTTTAKMAFPVWLHNQMQAENPKDFASGGGWYPNYNSPSWLNAWKALNVAVNAHILATSFNGVRYQDIIDFIDIRGYGNFGEWTNNVFTTSTGQSMIPTDASLMAIIDATVQSYPTFPTVNMIAVFDGNQLPNTKVSPAVGYYALTTSNTKGKPGWRRDNWGQTDGYITGWLDGNPTQINGMHFNTEIMARWQQNPIVGEPQDQGSAGRFNALPTQINTYHGNSFGNGNFNDSSNGTNATTQANFRAASANAGARFTLTGGNITTNSITLNWSNIGINPCYGFWNPTFEFRVGATVVATKVSSFVPHMFMPGTTVVTDNLSTVPNGTYDVYLLMKDAVGFQFPMPLFITGVRPDGGYLLASGVVISNTPTTTTTSTSTSSTTTHSTTSTSTTSTTSHSTTSTSSTTSTTHSTTSTSSTTSTTHTTTTTSSSTTTTTTRTPPPGTSIITNQVPPTTTLNDGTPLELGVRFRSSIGGVITGIRFWKTNANSGTHIGELYSNAGVRLATATFTGETPNQWQYVLFAVPVPIAANTTYVAAYFSPTGNYLATNLAFQGHTIVNGPLTMLADGTDGSNGVYRYNAAPIFPNATFQSSNYWVDVVFNTTTSTTTTSTSTSSTTTRSTTSTSTTSTTTHAPTTTTTSSTTTTTSSTTTSTTTHSTTSTTTSSSTTTTTTQFVPPPTTTTTTTTTSSTTTSTTTRTTTSTSTSTSTTRTTTSTSTTTTTTRPTTTTTSTSSTSSSTTTTTTQAPTTSTSTTSTTTIHVNQPPVARGGGDKTITLPVNNVLLNGSGSSDDGTIVSYVWTQLNGPSPATITPVGTGLTAIATATDLIAGIYTFELRITDNNGLIGLTTVNVTVKARSDAPPMAIAYGSVPPNAQPGTVTADGSQSTGNNLKYSWTQQTGPNALIVANTAVITNIILPLYGSYTFRLTVTDDEGRTSSSQLPVSIEEDFDPTTINFNT